MFIALTGTPGTGKTTVAELLAKRNYAIATVEELAVKHGCLEEIEGHKEVDVKKLAPLVQQPTELTILEGHLAHFLPCQMCIVLRCNPDIIRRRLEEREYGPEKVKENIEAEAIDLILSESVEHCQSVFEIDASDLSQEQIADIIETIMNGGGNNYSPGKVDWSMVVMDWY